MAAGDGIVLLPQSTAAFYTRPGIAYTHVSDISPNQVCLAWDATRHSRLIQDLAAIAADHPPIASQAEPDRAPPAGPPTPPQPRPRQPPGGHSRPDKQRGD